MNVTLETDNNPDGTTLPMLLTYKRNRIRRLRLLEIVHSAAYKAFPISNAEINCFRIIL